MVLKRSNMNGEKGQGVEEQVSLIGGFNPEEPAF